MLRAAGRQIAKRHKKAQRPHGRQSVKKLMAHGENVNSIEVPKVVTVRNSLLRKVLIFLLKIGRASCRERV